jgi:hypothetical protein
MRRLLTLVCLLCLAVPAGISISGCTRNPGANYCNGEGYGPRITDVANITLAPATTGISLAFGQTQQLSYPAAKTCKGTSATVSSFTYGSTNSQWVDVSPTGLLCAGTWNRNSGGGIANYTICSKPNPLPNTGGLPYGTAYVTAAAQSVSSNQVEIYVHTQVTSTSLAVENLSGVAVASQCYSQGAQAQLDSQACFAAGSNNQYELCAPASVPSANYACPLAPGVSSVPSCTAVIGTANYFVGNASVATVNTATNVITANMPGTAVITSSVAGSGSSAGYFSTCPPKSISLTLNGGTIGSITQGVQQNLVTTVLDTQGNPITGLALNYQSTNPLEISAGTAGAVNALFPGEASIFAICQPPGCNPTPINQFGVFGTGLSISSNPVDITTPGTSSAYIWFSAPGQSEFFVPVELITGTVGAPIRLPYVPNSMMMDQTGANLYFGSERELMVYSTGGSVLTKQDPNAPGVVLAVAPNDSTLLINDQLRNLFYIYTAGSGVSSTFGGLGASAAWTPDSQTLYITDSAALGGSHTDTLYVYTQNTGWTTYPLPATASLNGERSLAVTIPSVGAYFSGASTVAHTWCPIGTVGDYNSMTFYPLSDTVAAQTDVLTATADGSHILGASALAGGSVQLADIGVVIPDGVDGECTVQPTEDFTTSGTLNATVAVSQVSAAQINQVVASTLPPTSTTTLGAGLAFITYDPFNVNATGALLPYYLPASSGAGTVGYVTLSGTNVAAPLAGAFSPDNTLFFVSTEGDNLVHYIDVKTLTDKQQISPQLPACTPVSAGGTDAGCAYTGSGTIVPSTQIAVKPRQTT